VRRLAAALALVLLAGACSGDDDDGESAATTTTATPGPTTTAPGAEVAAPTSVEGPIEGGHYGIPYNPMPLDFAARYGYTEEEFFFSGEATAYAPDGPLGPDGEWSVTPAGTAPYTTRMLVRRPVSDADFNGTVVVEWLNVTAGRDSDPDFGFLYPELFGEGYAYVAVSAQRTGVEGGGAVLEVPGVPEVAVLPLTQWDPERYGDLDHPGDEYSYDIFSQAAQVLRRPGEVAGDADVLHGLPVEHVIAMGESQSAGRLGTYINAVHPVTLIYDGFLVHSRGDGSSGLSADPAGVPPDPVHLRTDLDQPVLQFESETDLIGLGFLAARQDDTDHLVTWEAAGTAHADQAQLDYGEASGQVWIDAEIDFTEVCGQINLGPHAAILRAAFHALGAWVVDGTPPPTSPRIEDDGTDLVRDEYGNVLGGVRTPDVDAPTLSLTGANPSPSVICSLFGGSAPLSQAQLDELYADHDDYVAQVTASADAAVDAGFLLPADRDHFVDEAERADVP
jgi:Alpha/beta hydrolase domain